MTNSAFGTNIGGFIAQDQVSSPTDRALLIQVRQALQQEAPQQGTLVGVSVASDNTSVSAASAASTSAGTVAAANVPHVIPGTIQGTAGMTTPNFSGFRNSVHFIIRDGVVTIVGVVPTLAERQQIESIVQSVPGVTQAVDNLQVRGRDVAFTPADQALLAQVQQAIQPVIVSLGIPAPALLSREGVVTLVGTVPSVEQSQQIESIVAQTPGVIRVSNRMAVDALTFAREQQARANLSGSTPLLPNRFNLPQTNQVGATTNLLLPTSRFNAPNQILGTNQQTSP